MFTRGKLMTVRYASWLLIASSILLSGCVAAVLGGSGTVGATTTPAGAAAADQDARLSAAVRARLAADAQLRGANIGVSSRAGVVTLSGAVGSAALRAAAERDARAVDGVRSVTNTVTVK
jgi:hyperosmotically inducible protein